MVSKATALLPLDPPTVSISKHNYSGFTLGTFPAFGYKSILKSLVFELSINLIMQFVRKILLLLASQKAFYVKWYLFYTKPKKVDSSGKDYLNYSVTYSQRNKVISDCLTNFADIERSEIDNLHVFWHYLTKVLKMV